MGNSMGAAKQNPVGYRFHPTEEELLDHYLLRKNRGEEDTVCVIPEVDLYRWEPEELVRKFRESSIIQSKDPQWWFFTEQRLDRTQQRSTDGGFWKKTSSTREVKSKEGTKQVIGSKKILTFFRGKGSSSTKTDWIMHEYDLKGNNALNSCPLRKNYVLCMIKCNSDEWQTMAPYLSIRLKHKCIRWIPCAGFRAKDTDPCHKPRKQVMDATCTAKGEETNTVAALGDHKKSAQELKPEAP